MEPPPQPPGHTPVPADARQLAVQLVTDLRRVAPAALRPRGIDIGPAVEQVLFLAIRDRTAVPAAHTSRSRLTRRIGAAVDALRPRTTLGGGDVLVVLLAGIHARLFDPVGAELARRSPGVQVVAATAGRAARDPSLRALPTIARQPGWRDARAFAGVGIGASALRHATARWPDAVGPDRAAALRRIGGDAVARLGVEAIRLEVMLRHSRPRVIVTYDEIDAWGRLLCTVAAPAGVPVVDLPHAEAVDAEAIRGVGYEAMGVYGPRAARVLEAAGVAPERVAVVGPAGFDDLVHAASRPTEAPPRVLLAGQFRGRAMTNALRQSILAAAVAAAEAVAGTVEVVPHPTEAPSSWQPLVSALPAGRTAIGIVRDAGLHERLPGAALLVTGWSNSVYEAVLAGVPAMTVHAGTGEPPMPFAREGIATEVHDPADAAATAPSLVIEPARSAALARARPSLADHLGPLDGKATTRTADLVARFLES